MTCQVTESLRLTKDEPGRPQFNCAVCNRVMVDFAVVGKDENLCWETCFGWFSGYPWVLFERGILKTHFEIEFFVEI